MPLEGRGYVLEGCFTMARCKVKDGEANSSVSSRSLRNWQFKKKQKNSNMLLIWKNSLRLTTASTWRTATTSVRPLLASESKHELTSSKNALEDKEIKHSNICFCKSNRNRIDRNSVYQARKEGMQFYLVTEGDFSMTDRRTLDKGGMSSADSGMITSSGWVIFTKWEQSSCQSGAGQRAIKRH